MTDMKQVECGCWVDWVVTRFVVVTRGPTCAVPEHVPTLADINVRGSYDAPWDKYTLHKSYAVGRYGHTGTHTHLVSISVVIKEDGEHRPGTLTVGQIAMSAPLCNSQRGQHGATPEMDKRWDTKDVTCAKCRVILGVRA